LSPRIATLGVPRLASPEGLVYEALPYPEAPDAGAELLEAVGPSVLVTHSHGGFLGWCVALRSEQVRGIISYEPVRFVFPEGERPSDLGVWGGKGPRAGEEVPLDRFRMLTRSPIQIVYGDYLDTTRAGGSQWTDALRGAAAFAEAVNRHGGDAEVLCLPSVGIRGNSHFMFSDLNNQTIADLMADWLARKGLDAYDEDVQQCR
jgi:pimeloyl-ACP methyl ester carboxylesterase